MRRICALAAALLMLFSLAAASGEDGAAFVMAGCDTSEYRRDWNSNLFFARMREQTGVSFSFNQFYNKDDFSAWKQGLTPDSADLPDVLFKAALTPGETRTLYERGVLIDLRPYIQENMPNLWALLEEHPNWKASITQPDGAIVALPLICPIQANNILWVNTDWLSALQMEAPTDAESLTAVLRAFKTGDPNRNGRDDEVPLTFTGMWDLKWLLHAYGIIMNDYGLFCDDRGVVTTPLTTDAMRAGLTWLHGLWSEGLIDASGFTAGESLRRVTDETTVPYGMALSNSVTSYLPSTQVSHYAAVSPLEYGGTAVYRSLLGEVTPGTFAVTCRCSDPAAVLRWADRLYSEEGCFLARAGLEGEEYTLGSDGTWRWAYAGDDLVRKVYVTAVIGDDIPVPGYIPVSYQERYAGDPVVHRQVQQSVMVAEVSRMPCPMVTFTKEEAERLAEIWPPIARYIEYSLTWFVTGDTPLTDETWAAFEAELTELGMPEVIGIWQAAVDRYEEAKR